MPGRSRRDVAARENRSLILRRPLSKFTRIVRDLARATGKQVKLDIDGQSTEVDRTLLEAIATPLTHLIRNAVDHGIEAPELREANGKPVQGSIHLSASHEGERVVIEIRDDGGGIPVERIKAKAVERGLISPLAASTMPQREAINLIFHAGLSTAEAVTNISGRGVGMDAVKNAIEAVNGLIRVETEAGKGSVFRLEIPLTLAIIPALKVKVGGETLAIPQVNTVEVVLLDPSKKESAVRVVGGTTMLLFRDEWVPVLYLSKELALPSLRTRQKITVIITRTGLQQIGLVVDEILDTEEVVVKPLIAHLRALGCYAGTTIGGDGRVILILDVVGLMRRSGLSDTNHQEAPEVEAPHEQQPLLLCRVGDRGVAVPLLLVTRIADFPLRSIQRLGQRRVIPYWGHFMPLIELSDHLPVPPLSAQQVVKVLVLEFNEKRVGIMVDEVFDSVEYDGPYDQEVVAHPGVLASILPHGKAVLLLNVFNVVDMEEPSWFRRPAAAAELGTKRILLAEDSSFFRKLVQEYLKEGGYRVEAYEDGELALSAYAEGTYDLVVTDLEMPNLDGFGLARGIRSLPGGDHVPVIALTALTTDEARRRAVDVGIDEYLIKVQREQVLEAVGRLLRTGRTS